MRKSSRVIATPRPLVSVSLLLTGVIVAAGPLTGCSVLLPQGTQKAGPSSTITATPIYTTGDPIEIKDNSGNSARVTILSAKFTNEKPGKQAPAPRSGKYLVLEVLWEVTSGKMMVGSSYVTARDDNGNRPPHVLFTENSLPMGYVIKGDKSKGVVAFDVEQGPVSIIFNDMTLQKEYARVKLAL